MPIFQLVFLAIHVDLLFLIAGLGTGDIDKPVGSGTSCWQGYLVIRGRVREEPVIKDGRQVFGCGV